MNPGEIVLVAFKLPAFLVHVDLCYFLGHHLGTTINCTLSLLLLHSYNYRDNIVCIQLILKYWTKTASDQHRHFFFWLGKLAGIFTICMNNSGNNAGVDKISEQDEVVD